MAGSTHASPDFKKMLEGYGLTTAEILYGLPDHPRLLQSYLWQEYDVYPEFPQLQHFLNFWQKKLEGPLRRITIVHRELIKPAEFKIANGTFYLN